MNHTRHATLVLCFLAGTSPAFGVARHYELTGLLTIVDNRLGIFTVGQSFTASFDYDPATFVGSELSPINRADYFGGVTNLQVDFDHYSFHAPDYAQRPFFSQPIGYPHNRLVLHNDAPLTTGIYDDVSIEHGNGINFGAQLTTDLPLEAVVNGFSPVSFQAEWNDNKPLSSSDPLFFDSLDPPLLLSDSFAKATATNFAMLFYDLGRFGSAEANALLQGWFTGMEVIPEPATVSCLAICLGMLALQKR